MITGSCLCRTVIYELSEPPENLFNCHCTMCRKAHGAAFATFATVKAEALRFTSGGEHLVRFHSSPLVQRCFCRSCGSPVLFLYDGLPKVAWVVAGTLDDDPGVRPSAHIFVASRAPWHEITDELEQHPDDPPAPSG